MANKTRPPTRASASPAASRKAGSTSRAGTASGTGRATDPQRGGKGKARKVADRAGSPSRARRSGTSKGDSRGRSGSSVLPTKTKLLLATAAVLVLGIGGILVLRAGGGKDSGSTSAEQTATAGQATNSVTGPVMGIGASSSPAASAGGLASPLAGSSSAAQTSGSALPVGNGVRTGLLAGNWDVSGQAQVQTMRWGTGSGESIRDLIALPDGRLLVTGILHGESGIPSARQVHRLSTGSVGENSMYLGMLAADLATWEWFSVLPSNILVPQHMALGPDRSIYVGGQVPAENPPIAGIPELLPSGNNFNGRRVAILRIQADGSRLLWAQAGGPNQSTIRGMDVDAQGRVYWGADPSGQQQASYVLRVNPDGSQAPFKDVLGEEKWALYLVQGEAQLLQPTQVLSFYQKGRSGDGYDYDGEKGPWGKVRFSRMSFRHGGNVVCLPDGDFLVSASIFYQFREGKNKSFPAFDYFLGRYSSEGRLRWSTNLYQPGDSVHTPDQKPIDLAYDPKRDVVYALVKQHGSNVYRFKGELRGDSGNMMITWLGKVDAKTGALQDGWYFQNNRAGNYQGDGMPKSPPHPKLAGNDLARVRLDGQGRIYLAGWSGPVMWTTPKAYQPFPAGQSGGGQPAVIVLDPELKYLYATVVGNGRFGEEGKGRFHAMAVSPNGVFVGGEFQGVGFQTGSPPAWSQGGDHTKENAALVWLRW